jgi:hypothetical protein
MYKFIISPTGSKVIIKEEGNVRLSFLDPSPGNTDYEAYLAWVAEGNEAEEWSAE